MTTDRLVSLLQVTGRALLSLLFVLAGVGKLLTWQTVQGYMESRGVPGMLLPLVVALEVGGGAALLFGLLVQWAAGALAVFCIAAALIFHFNLQDRNERTAFLKDLALAGALVLVSTNAMRSKASPGPVSG
ncbi:DoxX family protein [Bradyrhizobium diazoefficiens]|nr:DoxX family protein [Bradyrhizobium diazoefficiens]MBR0849486.1 DoxX family protein [Bradyrhizobium diazoefficiens]